MITSFVFFIQKLKPIRFPRTLRLNFLRCKLGSYHHQHLFPLIQRCKSPLPISPSNPLALNTGKDYSFGFLDLELKKVNHALQFFHCLDQQLPLLHESRGCFGSCTKRANFLLVQERSGGMLNSIDKSSVSDDFWTSSAYDIDLNTASLSQRSHSFLSISSQSLPYDLGHIPTSSQSEFKNEGLTLWNQIRVQWLGVKKKSNQSRKSRERCISVCATYDGLLDTEKAFRKPIPLAEMVEFLVDVWEEGLDD